MAYLHGNKPTAAMTASHGLTGLAVLSEVRVKMVFELFLPIRAVSETGTALPALSR